MIIQGQYDQFAGSGSGSSSVTNEAQFLPIGGDAFELIAETAQGTFNPIGGERFTLSSQEDEADFIPFNGPGVIE